MLYTVIFWIVISAKTQDPKSWTTLIIVALRGKHSLECNSSTGTVA